MRTNFESKLTNALKERADNSALSGDPAGAWQTLVNAQRHRKRQTSMVSVLATIAIVIVGVGAWKVQRAKETTQQIATQDITSFRLLPSIVPGDGVLSRMVFGTGPRIDVRTQQWVRGKSSIILQEVHGSPGKFTKQEPNDDIECGCMWWSDGENEFSLSYTKDMHTEAVDLAYSVERVTSSTWATVRAPTNLDPLVDETYNTQTTKLWGFGFSNSEQARLNGDEVTLISEPIDNDFVRKNAVDAPWFEGEPTTVRGKPAKLVTGVGTSTLVWEEEGYRLRLSGPDTKAIVTLAKTLRVASFEEYNELPQQDDASGNNSVSATHVVVGNGQPDVAPQPDGETDGSS